jgi:hypothetical protein
VNEAERGRQQSHEKPQVAAGKAAAIFIHKVLSYLMIIGNDLPAAP